jgi:uncharacterized protein YraI
MTSVTSSIYRPALIAAVAIATMIGATTLPAEAQPVRPNGYPVTNVNLRAGPGIYYPVIVVVPTHAPISILGCLGDYTWCDVFFQGNRGWMRSIYLQKWYSGYYYSLRDWAPRLGLRVVSFDIGPYWDSYYRERPFYRDRGRWGGSYGEGWTDRAVFYDRLEPYGDWIWLQGQYVWVPRKVGPYWRPYTVGRWVYTDRYGWMWSSREPFGWATYHYGRWGFSNRVGWFWVPGGRWAPAWVSWRQSNDYLAWAPLPPTPDEGLGLTIRVGVIPDYYWQVVPTREFLDDDLPRRIVRDRNRFNPILRETQPIGNVTVVNNNMVVNNVVNVTYVEQKTEKKVRVHKVERTKDEKKAGKVEGATVEIFQPAADQPPKVTAPAAPKPIEEVAQESKTKEQGAGAPSTEELLVPAEIKTPPAPAEGTPSGDVPKEGTPAAGEAATPPPPPPPAEGASAEEETAPPPPPPPAEEAAPPTPAAPEQAAPPPPPQPAEEAAPPTPAAPEQAAPPPPPPPAEEAAPPPAKEVAPPPPAPTEEAPPPPPPPAEQAAPPPPAPPAPEEAAPPPPAEEAAPPPPPVEEAPKVKKEPKPKKEKGERPEPEQAPMAPPPPPPEDVAPPPPPPSGEEAPMLKKEGKQKPKKKEREDSPPENGPPPSFEPPPSSGDQGGAPETPPPGNKAAKKKDGNGKPKKGKGEAPGMACPEGMVPAEDGSCVPTQ